MMVLREMTVEDLDQVMAIEEAAFSVPWTREGFFTFLNRTDTYYVVAEEEGQILGYAGSLKVLDEAEITNVAVEKSRRKEGIGSFMTDGLLRILRDLGVKVAHLEVRKSNQSAKQMYERVGFLVDGVRKGYYSDPVEDAFLMSTYLDMLGL